ncbi:polysaccharide pyruvyl transferase family protein [Acuticoccus sediminis]|uniref:polysaccharide pyruvyl transferase family protein n=1 Tax=Acuticoccus sediminis TaxID=2184697 RepID=UPI001CFD0E8E|nr:polysaccharide pyruvyl transferase family protein [Acuticoccus sediminis]
MKTVALSGTNGGVCFASRGFATALNEIGQNTGNAMFQYALWQRIAGPKLSVSMFQNPAPVREMADVLVIPAANQINPKWDLGAWADFVERVELPCVVLGLGAQAAIDSNPALDLSAGTLRFLHALRERATTIGVRGEFTRRVLELQGVTNTAITGCPSQTINPHVRGRTIAAFLERAKETRNPSIAYVFGTMEPETRATEAILSRLVADHRHRVIYQTEPRILETLHERQLVPGAEAFLKWIGSLVRPDMKSGQYQRYVLNRGRFFSDARTWIDAMREYDVTLGLRIHGAVAAIQANRPGICVAFDSRTLELAETMGYPYVRGRDLAEGETLRTLLDKVVFDPDRLDQCRALHTRRIDEILQAAGIVIDRAATEETLPMDRNA